MKRALILSEASLRKSESEASFQFPYDADLLRDHGFELSGTTVTDNRVLSKLRDIVEHRSGVLVESAIRGLTHKVDVVIALLEQYAVAPGIIKSLNVPPFGNAPLVVLSVWLAEVARTSDAGQRKLLARRFNRADLICHLSSNQTEILVEMGIAREKVATVPFGVNTDFFSPGQDLERDIPILAVGQDRGRDYGTLFDAVRGSKLTVDLVCKPVNLTGLERPQNVTLRGRVDYESYRDLLRRAQIVVVPTFDFAYPTGQTVAMEAAASGACVVVTRTQPMAEYFQHGVNALMVSPQDPAELREVLETATSDSSLRLRIGKEGRSHMQDNFTTKHLWAAVVKEMTARNLVN